MYGSNDWVKHPRYTRVKPIYVRKIDHTKKNLYTNGKKRSVLTGHSFRK